MPATRSAYCATRPFTSSGPSHRVTSMTIPTRTMLATVPMPKRSLSGIHSRSTRRPVMMPTVPSGTPVLTEMPWWKTCHGAKPRPERTWRVTPTPNMVRPTRSWGSRLLSSEVLGRGSIRPRYRSHRPMLSQVDGPSVPSTDHVKRLRHCQGRKPCAHRTHQ